jgi:hypothetical protein
MSKKTTKNVNQEWIMLKTHYKLCLEDFVFRLKVFLRNVKISYTLISFGIGILNTAYVQMFD